MNAALQPYVMDSTTQALVVSTVKLQLQRDRLADSLRDLAMGADIVMPHFEGAARDYMREVRRVALAALEENGQ